MKQFQLNKSPSLLSSKSLSDSNDDKGGDISEKRSSKKRQLMIHSDGSDDGGDSTSHYKKRLVGESTSSKDTSSHKKYPSTKHDLKNSNPNLGEEKSSCISSANDKSTILHRGAPKEDIFNSKDASKKDLKPLLKVGDEVYAAWWPDKESRRTHSCSSWYPGRIKSVKQVDRGGEYGPIRFYSVKYDDGDELDEIEDYWIFPEFDYQLDTKRRRTWVGVKNILDQSCDYYADQWARLVGWYTATIDGIDRPFSLLSEALRAYDASVVRRKGGTAKESDLNLPEEWDLAHTSMKTGTAVEDSVIPLSDLRGVSLINDQYFARITRGQKIHDLGCYKLAADAALAYDKAQKFLKNPKAETNFATEQDHKALRVIELKTRGLRVDFQEVQALISLKFNDMITQVRAPSCKDSNVNPDDKEEEPLTKKRKGLNYDFPSPNIDTDFPSAKRDSSKTMKDISILVKANPKKKKGSIYVGVSLGYVSSNGKAYISRYYTKGQAYYLGNYALQSDAAMAYDQAVMLLGGPHRGRHFPSLKDYETAKAKEVEETSISFSAAMSVGEIEAKVNKILGKASAASAASTASTASTAVSAKESAMPVACPKIVALNHSMEKKWGPYLPSLSGEDFLKDYRESIHKILHNLKPKSKIDGEKAPVPSTVSVDNTLIINKFRDESPRAKNLGVGKAIDMSASGHQNGNELNISMEKSRRVSTQTLGMHSSSNTAVLKLQLKPDAEPPSSVKSSAQSSTTNSILRPKPKKHNLLEFTFNQVEELNLPYPVGCSVWFQCIKTNSGQTFHTGMISAVFMHISSRQVLYQVKVDSKWSEMIPENELCYAPRCPVWVDLSPKNDYLNSIQGEVLICETKPIHQADNHAVLRLKETLLKEQGLPQTEEGNRKLLDTLDQLGGISMTYPMLSSLKIGKYVRKLIKSHHDSTMVVYKARELVINWREIADKEKNKKKAKSCIGSQDTCIHFYTVLIIKDGNQFHLEKNVPSDRAKYRKISALGEEESRSSKSSNSTITTATGLC